MEKFTKGEWEIIDHKDKVEVWSGDDRIYFIDRIIGPKDEYLANANLIAAAPEMYEMLNIMRKGYLNLIELDLTPPQYKVNLQDAVNKIDATLAKARGE